MAFLDWSAAYELGIPEMDRQHRKWLDLLNGFYDGLNSEDVGPRLKTLLDAAYQYTKYHFCEEEKLMESIGYPELEEQRRMHQAIADKILGFRTRILRGQRVVSLNVTGELKSWFDGHVLVEDRKYAELYLSRLEGPSMAG